MQYLPEETLETLLKVFRGFTMPALELIPDSTELEAAMRRSKLHTPRKQVTEVNNPILEALGFDNNCYAKGGRDVPGRPVRIPLSLLADR